MLRVRSQLLGYAAISVLVLGVPAAQGADNIKDNPFYRASTLPLARESIQMWLFSPSAV